MFAGVYLTAGCQSEASSQQQDDVPGHPLMNHLPVQQSFGSLHLFTCETQMKCEHGTLISVKEPCEHFFSLSLSVNVISGVKNQHFTCVIVTIVSTTGQPGGDDEE